ncbi:MAG: AAA family ATPase [Oscillospiraceae bacterium]|nr:AAA family ATPase [Oscillospiraceae bacterium]
MGKIIAIFNQKGGVGKTTSCVNIAFGLHRRGKKVLLCDFDPQGNATSGLGVSQNTAPGSYDAVIRPIDPKSAVHNTQFCDVMPAGRNLAGADIEMVQLPEREYCLAKVLIRLKDLYDYILIDCPPSLGLLSLNALCAADSFLIPVQCEYYALEGLKELLHTVRIVRSSGLNSSLEIEGVLLTMFDSRINLTFQVAEQIKRFFPGKVYCTTVPRNVRLSEAPSHGMPVQAYDPASRGAAAYDALAAEIAEGGSC